MAAFTLTTTICIIFLNFIYGNGTIHKDNKIEVKTTVEDLITDFLIQNQWNNIICMLSRDTGVRSLIRKWTLSSTRTIVALLKPGWNESSLLYSSLSSSSEHINIIVWCDVTCQEQVIKIASKLQMFTKRYSWLFIINGAFNDKLDLGLLNGIISPTSHVFTLAITKMDSVVTKYQVAKLQHRYRNSPNFVQLMVQRGLSTRGALKENVNSLPLQSYSFTIGVLHSPPSVTIDRSGSTPTFSGFNVEVMVILAEYLGFKYKLGIEKAFGTGNKDGIWTGLIGSVYQNVYNFSGNALAATSPRRAVVDFSAHVFQTNYVAVIRRPKDDKHQLNLSLYVDPLSLHVWLTYGAVCLLMFIYAWLSTKQFFGPESHLSNDAIKLPETSSLYWALVSTILRTDAPNLPKRRSNHILILTLSILIIFLMSCYMSLLTSNLAVRKGPTLYNDLDELIDEGKYGIAVVSSMSCTETLKNAKDGPLQRIWNKIQSIPGSMILNHEMGYKKVLSEDYVYFNGETNAGPMVLKSNCTMALLKERYISTTLHFMFPKDSPFKELLNLKILAMRSSGILRKLAEEHYPRVPPGACKSIPRVTVSLEQTIGAFAVFFIGTIFSTIYLFSEIMYENRISFCCHSNVSYPKPKSEQMIIHNIKRDIVTRL